MSWIKDTIKRLVDGISDALNQDSAHPKYQEEMDDLLGDIETFNAGQLDPPDKDEKIVKGMEERYKKIKEKYSGGGKGRSR